MILRYTLNNTVEGEYITTYSPKGWEETELVLRRHDNYDGIFWDYSVKVDFFCGAGKEYIDRIKEREGIDGELSVKIEMDCNETGDFELLYNGKGVFKSYEKTDGAPEYSRLNLEESGIIFTVLNRLETKIDLTKNETLDGVPVSPFTYAPYDLTTHSKSIVQRGEFGLDTFRADFNTVDQSLSNAHAIPLDIVTNEINEMMYPSSYAPNTPLFLNDANESRDVVFSGRVKVSVLQRATINPGGGGLPTTYIYSGGFSVSLVVRDSGMVFHSSDTVHVEPVVLEATAQEFDFNISETTISVPAGYYVSFGYVDTYVNSLIGDGGNLTNYDSDYSYKDDTNLSLNEISETAATTTKSFAVYETGADIARKITGQADSFRSNYFGRKNSQPYAYNQNGCGSFTAFTNGFQLRGFPLSERPVYMSMKEYFEGLSAIHCLGLGLKQEGDNTYIEIEPKDYFYRNDEVVLTLNNVRGIKSTIDEKSFYNRFKIGFKEWRKEGLNGLDEFCTTHEYATLLKSVNNELTAQSDFIAGPYALERQRRKRYSETATTDEDYDNNNFIIALNRTVDGSGIPTMLDVAEKDENFTNVSNVFSPETIYNLRFSPARSARNWFKILATSVIKLNDTLKNIKFTFADGNKNMVSKGTEPCDPAKQNTITEGEDIVLNVPNTSNDYEPIFTGDVDTIDEYPLSFASYLHLKSLDENGVPNYYKMVRYSKGESDYLFGFIDELRYKPITGKGSFRFKRAYNRDADCTHIYVEAGYVECGYVE